MEKVPIEELEKKLKEARKRSVGSKWRHYKGGQYVISGISIMEATNEIAVIYSPLENPDVSFVRPITVWAELVEWNGKMVPRFSKI